MNAPYCSRITVFLLILAAGASAGCEERKAWSAPAEPPAPSAPVSQTKPSPARHFCVVQPGDGWWHIAQTLDVSMDGLLAANGATTATPLNPGQLLVLPAGPRTLSPIRRTRPVPQPVPQAGPFIPYPGNGLGPTPCADGTWSHSSGRGTCSHHGGIL
jgi:hypothetical protein